MVVSTNCDTFLANRWRRRYSVPPPNCVLQVYKYESDHLIPDNVWNACVLVQGRDYLNYSHQQYALDFQEIQCQVSCGQTFEIFSEEFYLFIVAYIQWHQAEADLRICVLSSSEVQYMVVFPSRFREQCTRIVAIYWCWSWGLGCVTDF